MGVTQSTIRRVLTGQLSSKYFVHFAGIVPLDKNFRCNTFLSGDLHETEWEF